MSVIYAEPYPATRGDRYGSTLNRPHPHRGQDTAPGGLPAPAVADGVVAGIRAGRTFNSVLGNIVVVKHADGKFSAYCHLASVSVSVGQRVSRGQGVGTIGSTGSAANGRHLHYTLGDDLWGCESGSVQDPLEYIWSHATAVEPAASAKFNAWTPDHTGVVLRIQKALKKRGRYDGALDDVFGPKTWKGVQESLHGVGYPGADDGKPGFFTCWYVQVYAKKFGSYTGGVDADLGLNSWKGFALGLERP